MHDRRLGRFREVRRQPAAHLAHDWQLARLVVLPQAVEAPQLALQIARGLGEALQAGRAPVHGVHLHERVHQVVADAGPVLLGVQRPGHLAGDHVPVLLLHHVEGHAQHRLVVTGGEDPRRAGGGALERCQQARLAQHVVGGGRKGRTRRAAQHQPGVAAAQQVGDIGMALADPLGLDGARPQPLRVQKALERAAHDQRRAFLASRLLGGVHDLRRRHQCSGTSRVPERSATHTWRWGGASASFTVARTA